eukprot:scaffold1360_cov251-Prasinococcus_capsulatus_cf.AAC.1
MVTSGRRGLRSLRCHFAGCQVGGRFATRGPVAGGSRAPSCGALPAPCWRTPHEGETTARVLRAPRGAAQPLVGKAGSETHDARPRWLHPPRGRTC